MAEKQYPGYPPSYKLVEKTGGYYRTCIVIDLLSLSKLHSSELAVIQEQLEAVMSRLCKTMPNIERSDVVLQNRFDRNLRDGLRLS